MMNPGPFQWIKVAIALCFLVALVACGAASDQDPTPQSTLVPTATAVPTPTAEPEDDEGVVDSALGKVGDVGGAIWGGVSDAGGWVWGGISGAGGWLWDRVTGLPGEVEDVFVRFWRWIKGSNIGEAVLTTTISTIETARDVIETISGFSLSGFLWRVVRYVLYALLALIVVVLLLFKVVFPFLGGLPWRIARLIRRPVQSGRPGGASRMSSPADASAAAGTQGSPHQIATTSGDGPAAPTVNVYLNGVPVAGDQRSHTGAVTEPVAGVPGEAPVVGWSRDQIQTLRQRVSNPTITALFDLARARNGGAVNYQELMQVTNRSSNQVRADFAAFSRICKAVRSDVPWPINAVPPTDGVSRSAYVVEQQYLQWWFES